MPKGSTSAADGDPSGAVELPAPPGWCKKFKPKSTRTPGPKRDTIVFTSPTGDEIKNRTQLVIYLKEHPGGPSLSDFDWGTGETPRRSARIREKTKASEMPEGEPLAKRSKKSRPTKIEEVELKHHSDIEMEDVSAADEEEPEVKEDKTIEEPGVKEELPILDTKNEKENVQNESDKQILAEDADKSVSLPGEEVEKNAHEEAQKDKAEERKGLETDVVEETENKMNEVEKDVERKSQEEAQKDEAEEMEGPETDVVEETDIKRKKVEKPNEDSVETKVEEVKARETDSVAGMGDKNEVEENLAKPKEDTVKEQNSVRDGALETKNKPVEEGSETDGVGKQPEPPRECAILGDKQILAEDADKSVSLPGEEVEKNAHEEAQKDKAEERKGLETDVVEETENKMNEVEKDVERKSQEEAQKDEAEEMEGPETDVVEETDIKRKKVEKPNEDSVETKVEEVKAQETDSVAGMGDKNEVEENLAKPKEDTVKEQNNFRDGALETKNKPVEEGSETDGVGKQPEPPRDDVVENPHGMTKLTDN